jgi:hypothetical protein
MKSRPRCLAKRSPIITNDRRDLAGPFGGGTGPASVVAQYAKKMPSTFELVTRTPTQTETQQVKYNSNAPGL